MLGPLYVGYSVFRAFTIFIYLAEAKPFVATTISTFLKWQENGDCLKAFDRSIFMSVQMSLLLFLLVGNMFFWEHDGFKCKVKNIASSIILMFIACVSFLFRIFIANVPEDQLAKECNLSYGTAPTSGQLVTTITYIIFSIVMSICTAREKKKADMKKNE